MTPIEQKIPPPPLPEEPKKGDTISATLAHMLEYILQEIICISPTSVIYHQDEVEDLLDLITMRESDIADITGLINGQTVKISKRDARLLLHFVWWYHDLSSQLLNTTLDNTVWLRYEHEDFVKFRQTKVPAIAANGFAKSKQVTSHTVDGDVSAAQVAQFQKSIKVDVSQYTAFKGSLEQWLPFKRDLLSMAATHGIGRILAEDLPPISPGTQDFRLYQLQNTFMYTVFTQKLKGGPATIALRNHEKTQDARAAYLEVVEYYESKNNLMVISQKCLAKLQVTRLTRNYRGGAQAFTTVIQNTYLDLEYCIGHEKTDLEKKTTLLMAIEDENYFSVRDNLAMDPNKTYFDALVAIEQHDTMFIRSSKEKKTRTAAQQTKKEKKRVARLKKKEKKRLEKESNSNNTRNTNSLNTNEMLPSIDQSVWGKLPGEVKQLIAEHNRKVRDTRATNNNGSTTQNDTRSTNMATIAEHLNESIEPDPDNDDDQIEPSTSI